MSGKQSNKVTPTTTTPIDEIAITTTSDKAIDTDAGDTARTDTSVFAVPLAEDTPNVDATSNVNAASGSAPEPASTNAYSGAESGQLGLNTPADAGVGPRTRWAAIIWGAVFAAIAAGTLSLVIYPANRNEFADWLFGLAPSVSLLLLALAVGTLMLLLGLIGLLRRAQRSRAARRLARAS